jgi:Fe-S-cluster containining protein
MELVARADRLFDTIAHTHGDLMACKAGCDDCCQVYFRVTLIEAFVINQAFKQNVSDGFRSRAISRADQVEPLFRQADELISLPSQKQAAIDTASRIKIRCPLNEDHACILYEYRPITCRLYGTPQKMAGKVVSCPKNGFLPGSKYTTVDIDDMQKRLTQYSRDLLVDLLGVSPRRPGPLYLISDVLRITFDKSYFLSLSESL